MNETKKGFIQLHLSVLLAGFTGLFGRLITLNEVDIKIDLSARFLVKRKRMCNFAPN